MGGDGDGEEGDMATAWKRDREEGWEDALGWVGSLL